jgi:type IV secretion system protein VirB10
MDPKHSPVTLTKTAGVRRVNNTPLIIIGGALSVFVLIMMLVAMDRAASQNAPVAGAKERAGNTAMLAMKLVADQEGSLIPPAPALMVPADIQDLSQVPVLIAKTDSPDLPPMPPGSSGFTPILKPPVNGGTGPGMTLDPPRNDESGRIQMLKMQMLEDAAKARTSVPMGNIRAGGSVQMTPPAQMAGGPQSRHDMLAQIASVRQQIESTQRDDPTAAYQARLTQIRGSAIASGGTTPPSTGASLPGGTSMPRQTPVGGRNSLSQFQSTETDRWRLDAQPEAPRSPYELRAGFVVPATLISGVNSELPGQIMAQVSQDVYDTPTGRHVLIPQGSRLVGAYSSDVAYGQARVLVAWQRIVFPDGKAMDIGAMPGSDAAGYSGFNDTVNNHYLRLFASAFLLSGITAGITVSQDPTTGNNVNRQRASDAMSQALGQQLGQVTAQLIARNMNIAPTIEIRPGYRFNIVVTKDMTFTKPYHSFDY